MKMSTILYARTNKTHTRFQTLFQHISTVAELMSQACASVGLSSAGKLSGLVHDLGKASADWQAYLIGGDTKTTVPHAPLAAVWFWRRYGGQADYYKLSTAQIITLTVYGHHAGLPDILSPDGQKQFFRSLPEDDHTKDGIDAIDCFLKDHDLLEKADTLFESASEEWEGLCTRTAAKLPHPPQKTAANYIMMLIGLAVRYLYSCLIDADRLDAACWEDEKETKYPARDPDIWSRLIPVFEANLEKKSTSEAARAAADIHSFRRSISEQCRAFAAHESGVYRLYAPTGAGKCFSSLRYALHHAAIHKRDRIFFVIPYLSVLDQNAKDIREILDNPDGLILEHHSNVIRDEDDNEDKETKPHKLLTERWEAPIIITTMVQLLNTLFLGKPQSARRMQALSNAVIVIDEVQALPIHCVSLFNVAMTFLSVISNTTILLCTATQPALTETAYPLRLGEPADLVPDYQEAFLAFRRTQTVNLCRPGGHTCAEIAELAARQCAEQGSALVVMNTKRGVKQVYDALAAMETGCMLYYLTTELCAAHRLEVVEQIRSGLDGKQSIIVVSTSLIEFGMNLSFGCAIRAIAGLDSLVQVSGRCNRHGEQTQRPVFLLRCNEENTACLPELVRAVSSTEHVLSDWKGREAELLSPKAIQWYYQCYFCESERVMDAPVKEAALQGQSLCDYLGANKKALDEKPIWESPMLMHQSFRTAGEKFYVIRDDTTGVIVPWKEGKSLITELAGANALEKKKKLLRQAQRYTVSLYQNRFSELLESKAIYFIEEVGAYALRPEFYHMVFGVTLSPNGNPDDYML